MTWAETIFHVSRKGLIAVFTWATRLGIAKSFFYIYILHVFLVKLVGIHQTINERPMQCGKTGKYWTSCVLDV